MLELDTCAIPAQAEESVYQQSIGMAVLDKRSIQGK
jgi:hypothetical protein